MKKYDKDEEIKLYKERVNNKYNDLQIYVTLYYNIKELLNIKP